MHHKHYIPQNEAPEGSLRLRLNRWLFDLSSTAGRHVNNVIVALIVISVLISMVSTVETLDPAWVYLFNHIEIGVTLIFTLEYMLRLYAARRPMAYAFGFYGLIDLLTILPLLLFADANTTIRLLRLFRLLKLIRYLHALRIFYAAIRDVVDIMLVVMVSIAIVVVVAGNLIHFLEPENIHNAFEGCWWSLVTMTTVGYGDIVPLTAAGRIEAMALIMIGVTMFAMLTGTISVKIAHVLHHHSTCPHCGHSIVREHNYCPYCGVAAKDAEQAPPSK